MPKKVIHVGVGRFGRAGAASSSREHRGRHDRGGRRSSTSTKALAFGRNALKLPQRSATPIRARPSRRTTPTSARSSCRRAFTRRSSTSRSRTASISCARSRSPTAWRHRSHRPQGARGRPQDGGDDEPPLRPGQDDAAPDRALRAARPGQHGELPLCRRPARAHGLGRSVPAHHAGSADDRGRGPPPRPGGGSCRRACETIYASTWKPDWAAYAGDTDGMVMMTFENGVRGVYEGTSRPPRSG